MAAPLPPTLDFMRFLWAVDHGLQRRSKRMETELGVTGPQRVAIRLLARSESLTPSALADALHLHRSTVTGIVQRLLERGFLVRVRDPADGRRATLRLTASGRAVDAMRSGTAEAAVQRALRRFGADEVRAAARVLAAVGDELVRRGRLPRLARSLTANYSDGS